MGTATILQRDMALCIKLYVGPSLEMGPLCRWASIDGLVSLIKNH